MRFSVRSSWWLLSRLITLSSIFHQLNVYFLFYQHSAIGVLSKSSAMKGDGFARRRYRYSVGLL
jgi:hypothetical protein